MKNPIQPTNTIHSIRNPLTRSPWRCGLLLLPLALAFASLTLLPTARAVDPPPDGGYPRQNTAEGEDALFSLTTGSFNTATGFQALYADTNGSFNAAIGFRALYSNTIGDGNTANGSGALSGNETGDFNTANGQSALLRNTTGSDNTANGAYSLNNNTSGFVNTATGAYSLNNNTSGFGNTANGVNTLLNNTTGNNNIGLGFGAGQNLTTGSHNIDIGNQGIAAESNTIRIGTQGTQTATFIAGISGTALGGGVAVRVNANGQLGTVGSSARFKQNIKSMDKASEAIHALKPVTFRYKDELDPDGIPQFGLIAEEVEKINPALVVRDKEGKPYTVRYDAVNAMLLNEFLKEHRKVQEQDATIAELKSGLKALAATVNEQASQLEKVSAQIDLNRAVPQQVVLQIP